VVAPPHKPVVCAVAVVPIDHVGAGQPLRTPFDPAETGPSGPVGRQCGSSCGTRCPSAVRTSASAVARRVVLPAKQRLVEGNSDTVAMNSDRSPDGVAEAGVSPSYPVTSRIAPRRATTSPPGSTGSIPRSEGRNQVAPVGELVAVRDNRQTTRVGRGPNRTRLGVGLRPAGVAEAFGVAHRLLLSGCESKEGNPTKP
jgi:hypothetical protein